MQSSDITAVILAGGQGRRMGGQDKGLIEFDGRLLIEILIERLQAQNLDIVINANRNQDIYQSYGFPVVSDEMSNFQGPLAGFACAMVAVQTRFILTLPCDSPLLVDDFAQRFIEVANARSASIAVAHDGDRLQPVHALVASDLLGDLHQFLDSGDRKIDRWYAQHDYALVDFSDQAGMFRNINTPEDQQRLLQQQSQP